MAGGGGSGSGGGWFYGWGSSTGRISPIISKPRERKRARQVYVFPLSKPPIRHAGIAPRAVVSIPPRKLAPGTVRREGPPTPFHRVRHAGIAPRAVVFSVRTPPRPGSMRRFGPPTPARNSNGGAGVVIRFYRGPVATMPTLQEGEPSFARDTHQVFVGDGFSNHFIGGMRSIAPASSTAQGYPGEYYNDGTYEYRCYATNHWVRWTVSTF